MIEHKTQDARHKTSDMRLGTRVSCLTSHVSRLKSHVSCLMSHVSSLMSLITRHSLLAALLLVFLCASCEKEHGELEFANPLDPVSSNFVKPDTKITGGPKDSEVLTEEKATFSWEGNRSLEIQFGRSLSEYSFRLQLMEWPVLSEWSEWSEWTSAASFTFSNLDEGDYLFSVKSRYLEMTEEDLSPDTRHFTVDAVKGPTLMTRPRYKIVKPGTSFEIEIVAEEVTGLVAVHAVLTYDRSVLETRGEDIGTGDFLGASGGEILFLKDLSDSGTIEINSGVVLGNSSGAQGSGAIARIKFKALRTGETALNFAQEPKFRDPGNNSILVEKPVDGIVKVQ
jgi:hypothetical protein